jgi:hypothetical protein
MPVTASEVQAILLREVPEFSAQVLEHRAQWGDEPMLYLLLPSLRELAQKSEVRAFQIYAIVERMIAEGVEEVSTAFAIEMVEPFAWDTCDGPRFYPDLTFAMGPATLKVFQEMRDWQPPEVRQLRKPNSK